MCVLAISAQVLMDTTVKSNENSIERNLFLAFDLKLRMNPAVTLARRHTGHTRPGLDESASDEFIIFRLIFVIWFSSIIVGAKFSTDNQLLAYIQSICDAVIVKAFS
jgi:hypothetical protein